MSEEQQWQKRQLLQATSRELSHNTVWKLESDAWGLERLNLDILRGAQESAIQRAIEEEVMADQNVAAVRNKLEQRSAVGMVKYGTTTDLAPLELVDWLNHLQEELMDAAVYVEAALMKLREHYSLEARLLQAQIKADVAHESATAYRLCAEESGAGVYHLREWIIGAKGWRLALERIRDTPLRAFQSRAVAAEALGKETL